MPTYIMYSKLTPDGVKTLKNNPKRVLEVNDEVEAFGAKVTAQWATLGAYNFVSVVESPDDKTIARVGIELASRGTATYEIVPAVTVEEMVEALAQARPS